MLKIFDKLQQLDMGQLMALYAEGNRENAEDLYPQLSQLEGIRRAEADFESYLRDDFFRQKGACYCIWIREGIYVSALRLEPYEDGLLLEALETHPDHRRCGYAAMLIRAVQALLTRQGAGAVYSHVSKRNEASMRTHLACGFSVYRDYARYVDGTVTTRSVTLRWVPGEKE